MSDELDRLLEKGADDLAGEAQYPVIVEVTERYVIWLDGYGNDWVTPDDAAKWVERSGQWYEYLAPGQQPFEAETTEIRGGDYRWDGDDVFPKQDMHVRTHKWELTRPEREARIAEYAAKRNARAEAQKKERTEKDLTT